MGHRRTWTAAEVAWLSEQAGKVPLPQIARALERSEMSVRHMAMRQGLSLRCSRWGLSWCPSCASWRGALRPDGTCRVCFKRQQAERDREECERILSALSPARRTEFLANSSKSRGTVKPLPPRPPMPRSCAVSAYERQRAQKRHALAVEAWELACAVRAYDREKQRLSRLRKIAKSSCVDFVNE